MDDLPALTRYLIGALVLAGLFAAVLYGDSRRERGLRTWVGKRREARLHWPLDLDEDPAAPLPALAEATLGRAPLAWGAAVRIERSTEQIWFFECRTTLPGRESADWITIVARGPLENADDPAGWRCHLVDEVLGEGLLSGELARIDSPSEPAH